MISETIAKDLPKPFSRDTLSARKGALAGLPLQMTFMVLHVGGDGNSHKKIKLLKLN